MELLREWFIANKLSVNVLKTEVMIFSRKTLMNPLPPVIFDSKPIPYSFCVKFLGIRLDAKLNWKEHITFVRSKISSACNVLNHIRTKLTNSVARCLYYTLAYPHLTYGNLLWSSACRTHLTPIISAQNRIVKIVAKQGLVADTLSLHKTLNLLTFVDICSFNLALFVFKALHHYIDSPIEFLVRNAPVCNLRNPSMLEVPNFRSNQSQRFIPYRGSSFWNTLPIQLKESPSIFSLKRKLKLYFISQY